jgi:acyl-CoA dehydrogenase
MLITRLCERLVLLEPKACASLESFLESFRSEASGCAGTGLIAAVGGLAADRLGFAFVAGYHAALSALLRERSLDRITCLCVTEDKGAHPAGIETRLERDGDSFVLNGTKRWATMASWGDDLLIAASEGWRDGRNVLRMVRVPATSDGLELIPQPETPFIPEIPHFSVQLSSVRVSEEALLPGDGYTDYIKPFRTIEDIHVFIAAAAYALREVHRGLDDPTLEAQLLHTLWALDELSRAKPKDPALHVALHGLITTASTSLKTLSLEPLGSEVQARWARDLGLLSIAQRARKRRFEVARKKLMSWPAGSHS